MNPVPDTTWLEANQRWLTRALDALGDILERHRAVADRSSPDDGSWQQLDETLDGLGASMPAPPALEVLCATFRLTRFERNVVLLCAGVELDGTFARRCAGALGQTQPAAPTFSLALAVLPRAHWSALAPSGPLRRWRLVEIDAGASLTASALRVDERILHYVAGVSYLDPRLEGVLQPLAGSDDLVASHRAVAARIVEFWSGASAAAALPAVQLHGPDLEAKYAIAAEACGALGLATYRLDAALLPTAPAELDALSRLWARDAALMPGALVVDGHDNDPGDASRRGAAKRFIDTTGGALIVATPTCDLELRRASLALDVASLTRDEQHATWLRVLGPQSGPLNGGIPALVAQFDLGVTAIHAAARQVLARESLRGTHPNRDTLAAELWATCRACARPALEHLAQRIDPRATWEDLVLPVPTMATLREIVVHVRHRTTVYDDWGFATRCTRGLGISALFWGPSGAGKTMAAEVLANELLLDLYRVDLSLVVSKYIGETEKNLRRIFDAAEAGGAILLFDEADALFGKRSEVKDSHDRYANVEISYLLQRMEDYRGLAILTTNMKTALDAAFQRRIRFSVPFPFPDVGQRAEIWRRSFPEGTPTEGLDVAKLARLDITGGHIRNIALNAAFRAADERAAVQMRHLLAAARSEYAKMEKRLTDAETREWMP